MRHEYIVNYETYENGKLKTWGNQCLTVTGALPTANQMFEAIKAKGVELGNCEQNDVRIVGIFKL